MKLIVGLGNPGKEYEHTRHNVGFEVVESLAKEFSIPIQKKKFKALYGEGVIHGEKVLLIFPQTYMNLSGESVRELVGFFKVPLEDLVVVHDELDLPLGRIKVIKKAGPAGHRGVISIQEHLATEAFPRFRLGISKPQETEKTNDFVLTSFKSSEKSVKNGMVKKAQEGLVIWIKDGVEKAALFCHSN